MGITEMAQSPGVNDLVLLWMNQTGRVGVAPQDYSTGIPLGGVDQIINWNVAKLGAQPTLAQLSALVSTWQAQQDATAAQATVNANVNAALAAGIAITSTSTPALNATYMTNAAAQAAVTSVITGIATGAGLPGGGATFIFLDASGVPHTVTQAQFIALATAIRNYIYALDLYAANQGSQPAASVAIP